ncbi:MAG: YbfB/YjiJ family MFS transporter [Colwellia sp.]|nr:YbfB/YjiJ family MFS transporter [Colwellia sp.]
MNLSEQSKIQLACVTGGVITVGIARFAYTPMLPEMAEDIGLTETIAGFLAAANYAGYLCGALLISFMHNLQLKIKLYRYGLIAAVVTTLCMATTTNEWLWYLLRFVSGLSSAAGVLLGGGLLLHWLRHNQAKVELGIFFSSLGIGIVLTAITAQLIKIDYTWDQQWLIYGLLALILIIPVLLWFPDFSKSTVDTQHAEHKEAQALPSKQFFLTLQSAYFCAGFGYVVTATFLIAIVELLPGMKGLGWVVWLLVGIAAAPACWLWDIYVRKVGLWSSLLQAYILNMVSTALLLFDPSATMIYISAILYGCSFIGIVSMTLAMVGRLYPENPSKSMSHLTFSYGLAQVIAPAMVGMIAEKSASFTDGLIITVIVMLIGIALLMRAVVLLKSENSDPLALKVSSS